jgi:Spx/MgsR family transcriptional regulator
MAQVIKARAAKRPAKKVQFLHNPSCTTCKKARKFMEKKGFQLYFRDLKKNRLSPTELEDLIGERDYSEFLNSRNELYRKKKMKLKPPPRKEAIKLMSQEPNLIKRPVIVAGGRVVVGFDRKGIAHL